MLPMLAMVVDERTVFDADDAARAGGVESDVAGAAARLVEPGIGQPWMVWDEDPNVGMENSRLPGTFRPGTKHECERHIRF